MAAAGAEPRHAATSITPLLVLPRAVQAGGGVGSHSLLLGVSRALQGQLLLLALNLACCGGIVGLSRLLPTVAAQRFGAQSHSAVLLFVAAFGVSKALFNLLVGALANIAGRRTLLRAGWLLSCAVPVLLWFASSWSWLLVSTALLGASQGLCTSCAVVMLLDLVPASSRGVAMGALECVIYVSLGLGALGAAETMRILGEEGFEAVLLVHAFLCALGIIVSVQAQETGALSLQQQHRSEDEEQDQEEEAATASTQVALEAGLLASGKPHPASPFRVVTAQTPLASPSAPPSATAANAGSFSLQLRNPAATAASHTETDGTQATESPRRLLLSPDGKLSAPGQSASFAASFCSSVRECAGSPVLRAIIQAGFCNNLKDGVAWGLLPAFFGATSSATNGEEVSPVGVAHVAPASQLGALLTIYPLVWGLGQLWTGRASDRGGGRSRFVIGGLALQALGLAALVAVPIGLERAGRVVPSLLAGAEDGDPSSSLLSSVRFVLWLASLSLLGFGTALSYPVLQACIGDVVSPSRRASAIGLYRLCRDLGYAVGGAGAGVLADRVGVDTTFVLLAALLALSAAYAKKNLPRDQAGAKEGLSSSGQHGKPAAFAAHHLAHKDGRHA